MPLLNVAAAAAAAIAGIKPSQPDLLPRFAPGAEARYMVQRTSRNAMSARGLPELPPQETVETFGVLVRCRSAAEESAVVEVVYERVAVSEKRGGVSAVFDSERPAAEDGGNPLAGVLRPAVGQVLTFTVDRGGEVRAASGGERLPPALRADGGARSLLAPIFGCGRGAGAGAVKVGETWAQSIDAQSDGSPVRHTVTHRVEAVDGGQVRVATTGTVEIVATPAGQPPAPFAIESQRQTGEYTWDTATGALRELSAEMSMVVRDWSQGIETTQRTQTSVRIRRVTAPAPANGAGAPAEPAVPPRESPSPPPSRPPARRAGTEIAAEPAISVARIMARNGAREVPISVSVPPAARHRAGTACFSTMAVTAAIAASTWSRETSRWVTARMR
jgi:hypothetical protein